MGLSLGSSPLGSDDAFETSPEVSLQVDYAKQLSQSLPGDAIWAHPTGLSTVEWNPNKNVKAPYCFRYTIPNSPITELFYLNDSLNIVWLELEVALQRIKRRAILTPDVQRTIVEHIGAILWEKGLLD